MAEMALEGLCPRVLPVVPGGRGAVIIKISIIRIIIIIIIFIFIAITIAITAPSHLVSSSLRENDHGQPGQVQA